MTFQINGFSSPLLSSNLIPKQANPFCRWWQMIVFEKFKLRLSISKLFQCRQDF